MDSAGTGNELVSIFMYCTVWCF